MPRHRLFETQRVETAEDFRNLRFDEGVASVDVPVEALDVLPLKNDQRLDDDRMDDVERRIRRYGYMSFDPIVVHVGRRGRWVVIDGGHRLTAARRVAKQVLPNLFGRKVRFIPFLVYHTPVSNTLPPDDTPPEDTKAEIR